MGWRGAPLEVFLREQSYCRLHSGWSLAWDHFCGDIADLYSIAAIPEAIGGQRRQSLRDSLNIVKHSKTS